MFGDLLKNKKYKKKQRVEWVKVLDYQRTKKKIQKLQFEKIQLSNKLSNIANVINDNKGKIDKKEDMEALMDLVIDLVNEDTSQ